MNFWQKFKLYLGFYWALWIFIFAFIFMTSKYEEAIIDKRVVKLRGVLYGTTLVKNIQNTKGFLNNASKNDTKNYFQNYALETIAGIKKIFNSLYPDQSEILKNKLNDILRPYFERMATGVFIKKDKELLLDSLIEIFSDAQKHQSRILVNFNTYYLKLIFLVLMYQLTASFFYTRAIEKFTTEILEGFFNATDLSIISTISILFFEEDLMISYNLVFFGFFWHMLLLGATISGLQKEKKSKSFSRDISALIGGYTISFAILLFTAYFAINKVEFLICSLVSVLVAIVFGYYLNYHGALRYLSPPTPYQSN